MSLHGSIKELQNTLVQLYLKLEQRFNKNQLIRELWGAMANDVSQQIHNLNALPLSFWNQLNKDHDGLSIKIAESALRRKADTDETLPLRLCFDLALQLEEPVILKAYVPLIQRLRENLTAPALDFYIMTKAHLARITSIAQSFSGDPAIILRSNSLLKMFEKEVQKPLSVIRTQRKAKTSATQAPPHSEKVKKARKPEAKPDLLAKRGKTLRSRTKPIVKKVGIQPRRARR